MRSKILRCHAEGRDGNWEAICLELDVAVQGGSFEEVFRSLREAIALYLEAVADLPSDERLSLLHRPVPSRLRLTLLLHWARGLFLGCEVDTERRQFTVALAG
jgi:predicted RNase H-like HicB family nuclease